MGSRGIKGAREVWTWLNVLISTGLFGRCCQFALSCSNRSKELVPELSLAFCATGLNYEQLPRHLRAIRSAFASHLFCPKGLATQKAWNDAKQFLLDQLREVLSKASWDVARLRRRDDQHLHRGFILATSHWTSPAGADASLKQALQQLRSNIPAVHRLSLEPVNKSSPRVG
jgi:hypothetical protein